MMQEPTSWRSLITTLDSQTEKIVDSLLQQVRTKERPKTIFHYTNDVGLRGILESGCLWMTDAFALNDPSEIRHGVSFAISSLQNVALRHGVVGKFFLDRFTDVMENHLRKVIQPFTCSFSGDGDDLGQWRAYGDNGCGYALGFNTELLEEEFTSFDNNETNAAFPIAYDDEQLAAIHNELINAMEMQIATPAKLGLDRASSFQFLQALSVAVSVPVLHTALFFKHPAYRNESEFRLIQLFRADSSIPGILKRYRSNEMVKYREFNWSAVRQTALVEIRIGPAANLRKAREFCQACLDEFHGSTVEVCQSRIPYRV